MTGQSSWNRLLAAPRPLQVALSVFVLLLFANVVCLIVGSAGPGNVVLGLFGVAAVVLGVLLAANVAGSASAMHGFTATVRPGRFGFLDGRWTVRRYRLLGGFYVVLGCVFAVMGWSGANTWGR